MRAWVLVLALIAGCTTGTVKRSTIRLIDAAPSWGPWLCPDHGAQYIAWEAEDKAYCDECRKVREWHGAVPMEEL
jgi:hypothetical protein